jgi:hypothetical protein
MAGEKCRQIVANRVHFYAFICIFQHIKKPENQRNSLIFRLLSGVGRGNFIRHLQIQFLQLVHFQFNREGFMLVYRDLYTK